MDRYPSDYDGKTRTLSACDIEPGDIVMGSILAGEITARIPTTYGYRLEGHYSDGIKFEFGSSPGGQWTVYRPADQKSCNQCGAHYVGECEYCTSL